ncbi:MAG: hypothetical protein WBW34_07840 [Nitrososphaeraceae archaeon]
MLQCKSSDEVFSDPYVPGRGADSFKTTARSHPISRMNTIRVLTYYMGWS